MPVEGGRSSSFLTASATVPVSWLELGHVSSHRPSPPACETPYAALVRDHASTRAPKGECIMHEAAQHRVGCGQVSVERGARWSAAGSGRCRWRGSCGNPHRPAAPGRNRRRTAQKPTTGISHSISAIAATTGSFAGCGSKRRPTGHGPGRFRSGIPVPHRQLRDCA